jgi:hypothetical protein
MSLLVPNDVGVQPLRADDSPNSNHGHDGPTNGVAQAVKAVVNSVNSRRPVRSYQELDIPEAFASAVEKELTAGEEVLWLGRPSRHPELQPSKTPLLFIGAGILVVGLAIILFAGFHPAALLFGGVFCLMGGLFLFLWRKPASTTAMACYVVTNRRALVLELSLLERFKPRATTYYPDKLLGLERQDHAMVAGAGDLVFEYIFVLPGQDIDVKSGVMFGPGQGAGAGQGNVAKRVPRGFLKIEEVRQVERLIRTTLLGELESALDAACESNFAANLAGCREDSPIAPELKAKALAGLDANEKVVWMGQPDAKLAFLRGIGFLIGAGVVAAVAIVWLGLGLMQPKVASGPHAAQVKAIDGNAKNKAAAPQPSALPNKAFDPRIPVGLLLLAVGIGSVPFIRRHNAERSCYALTNRRAIVFKRGLFGATRESYSPKEVADMNRSNSWLQLGSGDLIFHTVHVVTTHREKTSAGFKTNQSVKTTHYGFLGVANVAAVEKCVRETLVDPFVDKLCKANSV